MFTLPATAQSGVTVQGTNEPGVTMIRSDNTKTMEHLPSKQNYTKFTRARIFQQLPKCTSFSSQVYPPFQILSSKSNRVQFASLKKQSGHKSLHTMGVKAGDPGVQKDQISLTTTQPTHIKIDWLFFCTMYDASVFGIEFKIASVKKSWSLNMPGTTRELGSLWISVNGTTMVNIEVSGKCKPGTGGAGNANYDGFNGSLNLNFLHVGSGSFTTYGTSCSIFIMAFFFDRRFLILTRRK
jgi:hypothetical protein